MRDRERFVTEFAGDDRVVGDYLLAEVLDRQPPRLRQFLLRTSIVDRNCRTHDVPNLFVADGSLFTTGAAANPTLTIVALAARQADYIAEQLAGRHL